MSSSSLMRLSSVQLPLFCFRTHILIWLTLLSCMALNWNQVNAGTWLSFNQRSGNGDLAQNEPLLLLKPKIFNTARNAIETSNPLFTQYVNGGASSTGNIINLLELCNERNKRKELSQKTPTNDLCQTLLSAVDYELQQRRR